MSDYIKREDAIKIINSGISIDTDADKRYVNGLFMAIPPADVAPVRHGRWVSINEYPYEKCSICGETHDTVRCLDNYCPNCGAKMDEDTEY